MCVCVYTHFHTRTSEGVYTDQAYRYVECIRFGTVLSVVFQYPEGELAQAKRSYHLRPKMLPVLDQMRFGSGYKAIRSRIET